MPVAGSRSSRPRPGSSRLKRAHAVLMHAASAGHTEAVKVFIAAGADINARNNEGQTALELASLKEHTETVNLLRQAGAVD